MASHGLALGLAVLALGLRLWQLDRQPLWLDEALTAHIAHAPDGMDFVHNTPPLYHWLTRWWTDWFGIGAAGLRSLSAVAGAGFVWLSFHTARAVFGDRAAWITALLVLASPLHLYYSQEARGYSLLLCELMLALWMLWRLAARPDLWSWILLVVASTAALHTHYLSALPLAIAHVGIGLSAPAAVRRQTLRAVAGAGVVACLLLLPWLLYWQRRTPFAASDMLWLALLWEKASGFAAVGTSLELFVLGAEAERAPIFLKQFTTMAFPAALRAAALAAMALLVVLALRRLGRLASAPRRALGHCAVLCLGPLLCLWLLSLVRPVYCPGRYDLIAFPGFVLLVGQAIVMATNAPGRAARWLAYVATAVVAVAVVAKDQRYFAADAGDDANGRIATVLRERVAEGEVVILCGATGLPVLVHLYQHGFHRSGNTWRAPRTGVSFTCRLLPTELESAPAAVSRYLRALEDRSLVASLHQVVQGPRAPGIWLVLSEELHGDRRTPAMERLGLALFDVLHDAGYEFVGGDADLGIAHCTPLH